MPRISNFSRSNSIHDVSITSLYVRDFLAPATLEHRNSTRPKLYRPSGGTRCISSSSITSLEGAFYSAINQASLCRSHRKPCTTIRHNSSSALDRRNDETSQTKIHTNSNSESGSNANVSVRSSLDFAGNGKLKRKTSRKTPSDPLPNDLDRQDFVLDAIKGLAGSHNGEDSIDDTARPSDAETPKSTKFGLGGKPLARDFFSDRMTSRSASLPRSEGVKQPERGFFDTASTTNDRSWSGSKWSRTRLVFGRLPKIGRGYHTNSKDITSTERQFAEGSNLPLRFFDDISALKKSIPPRAHPGSSTPKSRQRGTNRDPAVELNTVSWGPLSLDAASSESSSDIFEQMKLLGSVRELEDKLAKAKQDLERSLAGTSKSTSRQEVSGYQPQHIPPIQQTVLLTKEDYINLVDLYYYSHNSRFSPESTDISPTPQILDDYSFQLSSNFTVGADANEYVNEDENYESPLKKVEEMLKHRQLREIAVMQVFVDLLIDDYSSNRALYEAYKQLPDPGVAYLPRGIIRLFLQRMSTPWTLSEKPMLRYLSLIDDMQKAKIPITQGEWSSAVYLAGRAFTKITDQEVDHSFRIWRAMEREAGVQASHVTFNILFDIAVRAGKFALGETVMKEMHSRNLRLNRLGRVSLMYYHGLRKDGDGVRKAYRDFVEAGEIVDTLVLNCVISSLLNAEEPQAAEQVYARMKNLHSQLRKGFNRDGEATLYKRYPEPESNMIDEEMASNHLGRVLEKAPRLREILPEHHKDLQRRMPLIPDHVTFRSMIAYHATISGDLDRLTVLLQEMTDTFELPLQTITFQLLFKGFAIHGPLGGPDSAWSTRRLDLCWNVCRAALKESESAKPPFSHAARSPDDKGEDQPPFEPTLPSIPQIIIISEQARSPNPDLPLSRPPPRRLSGWSEFVLDLAAFPRERLKRLERFHATMFDAEGVTQPHENPGVHTYSSPFFQSVAYTAPEPRLDAEEGEYELPNSSDPDLLRHSGSNEGTDSTELSAEKEDLEKLKGSPHQVRATRTLMCWLLRAYARNSKSRSRVEEVWGQIRKVYRPQDTIERESVLRVLQRCLRDCDREGGG